MVSKGRDVYFAFIIEGDHFDKDDNHLSLEIESVLIQIAVYINPMLSLQIILVIKLPGIVLLSYILKSIFCNALILSMYI